MSSVSTAFLAKGPVGEKETQSSIAKKSRVGVQKQVQKMLFQLKEQKILFRVGKDGRFCRAKAFIKIIDQT